MQLREHSSGQAGKPGATAGLEFARTIAARVGKAMARKPCFEGHGPGLAGKLNRRHDGAFDGFDMSSSTRSDERREADMTGLLERIAAALERLAPAGTAHVDLDAADAFVWHAAGHVLQPVAKVNRVDISLLKGVERVRDLLLDNTLRFARGLPANNALLWGARGMGKSSLVKAIHAHINRERAADSHALKLLEIHREDIDSLPALMNIVRQSPQQFIVFCDDLSFDGDDTSYKSLKAALEGGIEGRPGKRRILCDVQPSPPAAARHDGERTLDRDQPTRGRRREGVAVGSLRPVARLP